MNICKTADIVVRGRLGTLLNTGLYLRGFVSNHPALEGVDVFLEYHYHLLLLFETFSYFWSKKESVLLTTGSPSLFSPQVLDMIIKEKIGNISGILEYRENIMRFEYLTSPLRNETLQTQMKPLYVTSASS